MNLNPVIIQRKNLRKKLWDDVRPQNDEQVKAELIYMKYGFFDESGFNLPIEPDTTPKLFRLCQAATELKHKASCVWKLLGENYTKDQLAVYCALYGITTEEALLWKS